MGTALQVLMYSAPISASAAKDITALMSWEMLRTVQLSSAGLAMLDDMKKWLHDFGLVVHSNDALLCTARTMSLAQ